MKLSLSYQDLAAVFSISLPLSDRIIETVSFDTRKINNGSNSLFFALKGNFRDGHDFVHEAYKKNGLAVFFKYRPLRMMNRCQRANPVEIQEILIY